MKALMTSTPAAAALDLCARIAQQTDVSGTITRLFLSPATHQVHALLREEMEGLGMRVRVDAAGNLRGLLPAADGSLDRVLLLGSHIDTVPNAGAFDGILGVAVQLAVLQSLGGRKLPYAIEVIAFSEEEGIRFALPFLGSRALVGSLDEATLARRDVSGATVADAIRAFSLDPAELPKARLTPGTFAFVEVHIEQGPVLEAAGHPLGLVEALVGQQRIELNFTGEANHAGTTPMHLRKDALAAAAEWIVAVERYACAAPDAGLRATVGRIAASPGAANVIPGEVTLTLDLRHADDRERARAASDLLAQAQGIAGARGLNLATPLLSTQAATALDPVLVRALEAACIAAGHPAPRMVSGAGHDAMILAPHVPSAMLFVRTPRGLSHHPEEAVREADVQAACDALTSLLLRLDPAAFVPEAQP